MTRIAQSYWQAELSRKAEGVVPLSELSNLFPKFAVGYYTRDFLEVSFLSLMISMKASILVDIWLSEKLLSSAISASIIRQGMPLSFSTIF